MTLYSELPYLGNNRFGIPFQLEEDFLIVIGGLVMVHDMDFTYNNLENTIKLTAIGDAHLSKMGLSVPTVKAYGIKLYSPKRRK